MEIGWWLAAALLLVVIGLAVNRKRLQTKLAEEKREVANLIERLSEMEQELLDVKARRKKLLSASTQALIIVERDCKISSANKVARKFFGKPHKDSTLMAWTRQHQLQELVQRTLDGEKMPPVYFNFHDTVLEVHARAIRERKEVVAVALAIHDITEVQKLSRARRDFVTNISHELRTPLASIQLLTDTLLQGGLEDKVVAAELTTKIAVQVDSLHQLAQEVLDLSMIESGKVPLKMSLQPLHPIVESQVNRFQLQAERKELCLENTIAPDIKVLVDGTMIGRVISNLVHNALKFTEHGQVTVAAHLLEGVPPDDSDEASGDWVVITVADTGVGISPDEMSRIFERFYKIDRARNRQESGTGLGLAIARHIVEAHGGKIWAEQNGRGAKFCFTVPTE